MRNRLKYGYERTRCLHQKNITDYLARPEENYDKKSMKKTIK